MLSKKYGVFLTFCAFAQKKLLQILTPGNLRGYSHRQVVRRGRATIDTIF